jgi:predicted RNA-binding protein YlxR (DUF448 family)
LPETTNTKGKKERRSDGFPKEIVVFIINTKHIHRANYVSKGKTTSHTKKNKQHIYGYVENKNENRAYINAKT